jgi:serine/threonine-protein kinase RsbW
MSLDPRSLPNQVVITSDLAAAREVQDAILALAQKLGNSKTSMFGMRLAMEEAMVNAHKHGNCCDGSKHITISYDVTPGQMVVRVRDEGCGFNPDCVPDCTAQDRLILPSGRGVMLMRSFLDQVQFNDCGNEVQLLKRKD